MSSDKSLSYLWVDDLSTKGTLELFSRAKTIKENLKNGSVNPSLQGKQVALVFSEASTRTKMSFQMAAQRLGAQCLVVDNVRSSSMSKGETFSDTFWTLNAIRPDLFVIRCGDKDPLDVLADQSDIPVINAGFGAKAHPTQALLDTFTLHEHFGHLEGLKVLMVGDIDHSRVASSDIKMMKNFGVDVKICAPQSFRQNLSSSVDVIESLDEGIAWCDAYMALRVQFERHEDSVSSGNIREEFQSQYSLGEEGLKILSKDSVIIHPGPVNWGVELQECVQKDSRLLMWQQKENGVYTRAALMEKVLKVNL